MDKNKFYITTPIYYVNDQPHIGHAYTTILADVLARYHRLFNVPTFFLTGTDEHGQKVEQAARAAGITPQEQADRTVVRFQELWKELKITHDDFIRTTEERHVTIVQRILQALYDKGEIYKAEYDGWYCVPCERFYTEKGLEDGKCPECKRPVDIVKESNYFFRMSQYQGWLVDYIQANPRFIQPDYRRNETLGFLRKPLNDLCISRPKSRLAWGIELPFDPQFVTYVWFDALLNYISAIGYGTDPGVFNKWWPCSCQLIGKDILTTHTVYWPTMLKAIGVPMPEMIFAHGWWLSGESKMSKSLGNAVNPMTMIERHGLDAFRYFLMSEMMLGQDASFTEDAFMRRYNADLANDLGNLLNRLLNMIGRYCEGKIPAGKVEVKAVEEETLQKAVQAAVTGMEQALTNMKLSEGLAQIVAAVRAINRYIELKQPWSLARREDRQPLWDTLYTAAEAVRITGALLYPVMPEKMAVLRRSLGLRKPAPSAEELTVWNQLTPGVGVKDAVVLFPRIDPAAGGEQLVLKEVAPSPAPAPASSPAAAEVALIEYTDFAKVQLRTARVMSAEKVVDATRLLRLEVLVGDERRQVVAGIALHYTPEQLIGKTVILVSNLKPAKIKGVESNGMLLAASKGEELCLVTVDGEISSGAIAK